MAQDYNKTLNLPQTDFQMRGNLPQKEPGMLKDWEEERLYYKMVEKNAGKPSYILHDGPPYANGDIHLGTALNKVLKDIIIKQKNMSGYCAPYVPGWDTHGLPIELKALKKVGADRTKISPVELRKHCREFALTYMANQRDEFKRLGVLGDFDDPYLTLKPEFEAKQIEIFGEMAKKGYIYKGLKPVYWCADCHTALAEAEIEYENDPCYSVYVKFKVVDDKGKFDGLGIDKEKLYFVIWTTTTWTLPANVAICLGPEFEYTVACANGEYYVMASALVDEAMKAAKIDSYTTVGSFLGKELEYITTQHPFLERKSLVILGDHVTLESGTGCVHTAPGHGVEDFDVCKNYKELEVVVPVDDDGKMTAEAGKEFAGLTTDEASKAIAKRMDADGTLFAMQKIVHQYPHCWRCHKPVLFRATEQWFCSVEEFKDDTIRAISNVRWIPEWGEERIKNMVRDRNDWCISRQRTWGVPIPILYCTECGKSIVTDETIGAISDMFRKEGSDAWFLKEPDAFLPNGFRCPHCGGIHFTKEKDIMDVWFDSGTSHAAVLLERPELAWPADLYLEGADQYRGWFQSSLLTSVAWKGVAPYRAVCTHGWVVDGEGRKMSKSLGNGIDPEDIIKQYGADILRLWVASSDYHADIRISKEILKQLSEAYRKIRNTARYILGNLNDFDPDKDTVAFDKLGELDQTVLMKLDIMLKKSLEAYDAFDFHIVFHAIHNFCVVELSNFYLDIIKDRLYCEKADSVKRRAAQTVMYICLDALTRLVAPILAFTSEEIWSYMPHDKNADKESVLFNEIPKAIGCPIDDALLAKWDRLYDVRVSVNKALEEKRTAKEIGSSLEASVVLRCGGELYDFLAAVQDELAALFIVSDVALEKNAADELTVTVSHAVGEKCERCWTFSETVGADSEHPTLCSRCAHVMRELEK